MVLFARPAWLNVSLPRRLLTTSGGPTRQLCFPAPSPSFVCSSDSFSTFVALPLDVKTNTGTRVGKETGGTRGKSSSGPRASERAREQASAGNLGPPLPRAGSSEPGRARRWRRRGPSPVRVLRVRSSPRREADNSCSGSLGSLTPRWAR